MQSKFYNERDEIIITPVARNTRAIEEKDDIQQLLEAFEMTKEYGEKQEQGAPQRRSRENIGIDMGELTPPRRMMIEERE